MGRRVLPLVLMLTLILTVAAIAAAPTAGEVQRTLNENLGMGDALHGRSAAADTAGLLGRSASDGLMKARALVAAEPENALAQDLLGLFLTVAYHPVSSATGYTVRRGSADPAALKEGLEALQKAATLAPQIPSYRLDYSWALLLAGQPEAARQPLSEVSAHPSTLSPADRARLQQLQAQLNAGLVAAPKPKEGKATEITWLTYEEALSKAQQEHKLVLVDFMAQWCGWCKKLDKDTFSSPRVMALSQKYVFARVDTDQQPQLRDRYKVTGFPTVISMKADGTEVTRMVGYNGPQEFLHIFQ